jgi:uncharacterized membrane protein
MKKLIFCILAVLISFGSVKESEAQTIEILAGNTLNGAMNGVILGGAVMGLTNDTEFHALRIGLGLGTLYGIGMGGYDLVQGGGTEILVSGLFNDGSNSSIIVLLDTFYGAAAGSVIATSVMLVANEPIVDGLQYGASVGAWVGFGFGIFDTFVLAKKTSSPMASTFIPDQNASGLIGMGFENGSSLGFINPSLIQKLELSESDISSSINGNLELVNFRFNF